MSGPVNPSDARHRPILSSPSEPIDKIDDRPQRIPSPIPSNFPGHQDEHHLAVPAHGFSYHAPSPPRIEVPPIQGRVISLPAYNNVSGEDITDQDLHNITQIDHIADDNAMKWKYEWRRNCQSILPFLYLGPLVAIKDREWVQKEEITMLLAVRDSRSALARLLSGEKVANDLGIVSAAVDVAGTQGLIAAFTGAIKLINDHLLSIYRDQAINDASTTGNRLEIDPKTFKKGKVVVFCESGNERSACLVAAYLQSMYSMNLIQAIQFIQAQRFCIAIDDEYKGLLLSYQDILQARRMVTNHSSEFNMHTAAQSHGGKRGLEETVSDDVDMDLDSMDGDLMDLERFQGRAKFAPYLDRE